MSTKTNNAFPNIKKRLRQIDRPQPTKVLDCYAGNQEMWKGEDLERYYPIDKESYRTLSIKADNIKIMMSLDLSQFNVIDVDAYGVPFKQLEIIFRSRFQGTVYFTFIQSIYGQLPKKLLKEFGYTSEMLKKTNTLFCRKGFDKFKNYLAKRGVDKIKYFNPEGTQKYYGLFTLSH
jgi:hypothetical protein